VHPECPFPNAKEVIALKMKRAHKSEQLCALPKSLKVSLELRVVHFNFGEKAVVVCLRLYRFEHHVSLQSV